jgi:hypothetical protein
MLTESAKKLKSAFTRVCDDEQCGVRIEAGKGEVSLFSLAPVSAQS